MENLDNEISFHGKLLKVVCEHWAFKNRFEFNDQVIRENLKSTIKTYLPTIDCDVVWTDTPELIDRNEGNGYIGFFDENGIKRILDFHVVAAGKFIVEGDIK